MVTEEEKRRGDKNNKKIGKLSQVTLILPAHRGEIRNLQTSGGVSVVFGSVRRRSTQSCRTYYINGQVVDTEEK